jgi:hypothetical protein
MVDYIAADPAVSTLRRRAQMSVQATAARIPVFGKPENGIGTKKEIRVCP